MKFLKQLFLLSLICSLGFSAINYGTFYFDGRPAVPTNDETVSYRPEMTVKVTGVSVSFNSFALYLDENPPSNSILSINPYNYSYDYVSQVFRFKFNSLSKGYHTVRLFARDEGDGSSAYSALTTFFVASDKFIMRDDPIIYPSPATYNTFITYELTDAEEVKIFIYDLNGQIVFQDELSAGEEGAHAGYNAYPFDLKSSYGNDLPNGVYVVFVTRRDGGSTKIMGKKKFIILREDED